MPLTDAKCKAERPRVKLYKLTDGGGLQLWVQPTGPGFGDSPYRSGGKQKLLVLGIYPTVSLDRRHAGLSRDSWLSQRKGGSFGIQLVDGLVDCPVERIGVSEGLMGGGGEGSGSAAVGMPAEGR